jgi:DHA2 family multidrug resistance protein
LCGLAPTLPLLVFFRVLQGAGGGGLQPVSQAILVESFPRQKQGMAMAIYGMGVVVAPIIGPTLGGWITDNYTWRWIFFINIPVGLLSLLLTSSLISDPPHLLRAAKNGGRMRVDYLGLAFLSVGLGFLQVMLDKGQRDDWFASNFITWCAIAAAVGLVGAVVWELRQKEPIIELHLFKDRNYLMATITMFVLGVVLYGTTVLLPLMLQTLMGYTAQLSGLVLSPGAILTMITLPIVGKLLVKYPPNLLVMCGLFFMGMGMFALARLNLATSFGIFVFVWMISRGSLGFLFVPINVAAFAFVPKERMNSATGMINLARNIGGSVGISLVTTWQVRFAQRHQMRLAEHVSPLNPAYQRAVHGLATALHARGSDMFTATRQAQAMIYGEVQRQSNMLAFIDVYWLLGILCLAVIPFMFFVRRGQHSPDSATPMH